MDEGTTRDPGNTSAKDYAVVGDGSVSRLAGGGALIGGVVVGPVQSAHAAFEAATTELLNLVGDFVDGWDGNCKMVSDKDENDATKKHAVSRVDGLKLAELRGAVAAHRKAAVKAFAEFKAGR